MLIATPKTLANPCPAAFQGISTQNHSLIKIPKYSCRLAT